MRFDILTIFPQLFSSFAEESLVKCAREKNKLSLEVHDLRSWTTDAHKTVDDKPFGGGLGMVMKVEPIHGAIKDLKRKGGKVVLFSPRGKRFTQSMAQEFSRQSQLILVCGRYEGVDERVAKHLADYIVSLGPFVLMGGEIPAMAIIEATSRLIPGVVGKADFLKEHIPATGGFIEYPQYTRPEEYSPESGTVWKIPKVLISGDHKKIGEWRKKKGKTLR
ncbi:MAG: tRNA (guanosine(37)-N1)-methyltransferase TrmD [bacterium]|nr:tRNA (guanosine(37)-N1)-methyltransferase TrmD [bacterium]